MQTRALDPFAASGPADETHRAPLPGLVVGDAAVWTPRRHGWPARLFIGFSYLAAVVLGTAAVGTALFLAGEGRDLLPRRWPQPLLAGVWAVLQWRLAGEVRRFSRWGWYGAMTELGAATGAKLGLTVMIPLSASWSLPIAVVNLAFMAGFWIRRADFDIGPGG